MKAKICDACGALIHNTQVGLGQYVYAVNKCGLTQGGRKYTKRCDICPDCEAKIRKIMEENNANQA